MHSGELSNRLALLESKLAERRQNEQLLLDLATRLTILENKMQKGGQR